MDTLRAGRGKARQPPDPRRLGRQPIKQQERGRSKRVLPQGSPIVKERGVEGRRVNGATRCGAHKTPLAVRIARGDEETTNPVREQLSSGGIRDMMEHRMGRRVPLNIPVRIRFQDGTAGFGLATNVSLGGIFVQTAAPWRSGCVDVRMTVPTPRGETTVLIHGLVVHAGAGGIGLMFRQLDQRTEDVLSWLLSEDRLKNRRASEPMEPAVAIRSIAS